MVAAPHEQTPHEVPRKSKPSVLISGGSIAGPAVAWWLTRKYGFETTIVERAPELRTAGQNIDVRGAGRQVIRQMKLEPLVLAANTTELGLTFVDSQGTSIAEFQASPNGPTAELEILRGDFAQILYDATKDSTKWVFGDFITSIDDMHDTRPGPLVKFHSGKQERYDFVIVADGIGSRTRKMVFGDEVVVKPLGLHIAYFTIPREEPDTRYFQWYTVPGRRSIMVRPDNKGTTRICLAFMANEWDKAHDGDHQAQIDLLHHKFANAGWISSRILNQLDTSPDLYYERLGQVKATHYSRERVVLLGDAAYCASPISGMGTTLSLVGSYILAGELAKQYHHRLNTTFSSSTDEHPSVTARPEFAFEAYQAKMEPFVKKAQKLMPGAPWIVHPETRWGVAILYFILSVIAYLVKVGKIFGLSLDGVAPSSGIELPDYSDFYLDTKK